MSEPIDVWYWVRGSSCSEVFSVEASLDTTTLVTLQQDIMESWSRHSGQAVNLNYPPRLYKVPQTHPVDLQNDGFEDVLGALSISDLGRSLCTTRTQTFRAILTSQLRPDHLHFVVDFPSYRIVCRFRGGHPDEDIAIELTGEENLRTTLKNRGKELWPPFKDMPTTTLRVFKISFNSLKELKEILDTVGEGVPICADHRVRDAFRDVPFSSKTLRIVIEAVASQNSDNNIPPSALQVRRGDTVGRDALAVTVESERSKFLNQNQNQRPSATAAPSAFLKRQADTTQAIPCGRPRGNEDCIPVTLLHPVFAQFKEDIHSISLSAEDDALALALANSMSDIYPNELQRATTIRNLLKTYNIHLNVSKTQPSGFETDGDISTQGHRHVLVEFKNEVGSTAKEPYFQAIGYYLEFTRSDAPKMWHSPLPCLLLSIFGPYIDFAGAAWNLRPMAQSLATISFCVHSTDPEDLLVLARHMAAFRKAIRTLKEYYETLSSPSSSSTIPPQLFPYPTTYTSHITQEKTEIIYKRQVSKTQLVFFGFEGSDKAHPICIKFVRRYSVDAHKYCASLGCAPALRGFETIVGGWFMVVMDDISNEYETLCDRPVSTIVKGLMAKTLTAIHNAGYVHGDLRDTNIMSFKSDAKDFKFIDFDWAGRVNEATYPPFVNREFWRPKDAIDWLPIRAEHDIEMLDHIQGLLPECPDP